MAKSKASDKILSFVGEIGLHILNGRRMSLLLNEQSLFSIVLNSHTIFLHMQNHTAHNQSFKAHRNGIKKPTKQRYSSRKG